MSTFFVRYLALTLSLASGDFLVLCASMVVCVCGGKESQSRGEGATTTALPDRWPSDTDDALLSSCSLPLSLFQNDLLLENFPVT